ncbi:HAD family hydrolase [Chromobacterium vaccinii]|uniref:HAD family hydrolase n=1 Tax=Chromobacterium vaccinii TaxID=1108595 RepID=UPI001E624490|nr:HAD family phosphatase [Chromobacterium vaccinii]MCD4500856.1 HAD family phosphatase [Chromobacterium vaccinii]
MNRSFDALLFDMDGLMLDTETLSCAATRRAGAELGIQIDDAMLMGMVGLSEARCTRYIAEYLANEELAAQLQQTSRAGYRRMLEHEEIPLKPGIVELLDWAENQGIPRAVATSTRRAVANVKLARSGLARYFRHTIAGDEVARTKPEPDIYLAAAALLGAAPERCIVLEDSPYGMQAGVAAGSRVLLVPDLIAPSETQRAQTLAVCGDLHQALTLLRSL